MPAISFAVVLDFLPVTFLDTSVPIELVTLVTTAPTTAPNIPFRRPPPFPDFFALAASFAAFSSASAAAAASAAALTAANAALAAEKEGLEKENAKLADENDKLAKALADAENNSVLKEVGPAAFYFEIGQTTLSQKELEHLDFYLKNVLPNVDGKKATVITGSADKKTGSTKRNQYLCEKRAEYLKNLLVEKYGIDAGSYVVNTTIAADGDANLSRAVIISFE